MSSTKRLSGPISEDEFQLGRSTRSSSNSSNSNSKKDSHSSSNSSSRSSRSPVYAVLERVPKPLRFGLSGAIGTGVFSYADAMLLTIWPFDWQRVTVVWTLSYLVSITYQHFLHRHLVYGGGSPRYVNELAVTYASYSMSIFLSAFINAAFIAVGAAHQQAWWGTLALTGILNYFVVSAGMNKAAAASSPASSSSSLHVKAKQ